VKQWHVLAVCAVLFLFGVSLALAHGEYEWIMRGAYSDPRTGIHCCGPNDCVKLAPEDVQIVEGGFRIKSLDEFVPASEYQISEDGN
jgi:hypothetical protein